MRPTASRARKNPLSPALMVAWKRVHFWKMSCSSKGLQRLISCKKWRKIRVYTAEPFLNELTKRRKWSNSLLQLRTNFVKSLFFGLRWQSKYLFTNCLKILKKDWTICWGNSHNYYQESSFIVAYLCLNFSGSQVTFALWRKLQFRFGSLLEITNLTANVVNEWGVNREKTFK